MDLLLKPVQWFLVSDFIYVMICYLIFILIYMYTNIFQNLRQIINYFILSINNRYLSNTQNITILFVSFYTILFFNILGFFGLPLIMSNPFITLVLNLMICGYAICIGIYNKGPIKFAISLCPEGLPTLLIPFMMIIELLSLLLKPLIFAFRIFLINNISHMILHIFENILINLGTFTIFGITTSFAQSILVLFLIIDISKAFIQAYLFTLSVGMYLQICTE